MLESPPSASQDSFGQNYGMSAYRWRFKRSLLQWWRHAIDIFYPLSSQGIYVVPSGLNLDTLHNMRRNPPSPVNARAPNITVARQSNGVHPAAEGFNQLADAVWAFWKVMEATPPSPRST